MQKQKDFDLKEIRERFEACCPELFAGNHLEYFHFFYCPVSIAAADVKEHIIEEYESIELLVLQLYGACLRSVEQIAEVTGLEKELVEKILYAEINGYAHIDKDTGELTQTGIKTLEANTDLKEGEKAIQHAIYDVKRELHIEAVTGTVIASRFEQKKEYLLKTYPHRYDHITPREFVPMDAEITREIKERLLEYKHRDILNEGNTIKDITDVKTQEIRYVRAFLAKLSDLPYPFIVLKGWSTDSETGVRNILYQPTSISRTNQNRLEKLGRSSDRYLVREDSFFEYLLDSIKGFKLREDVGFEDIERDEISDLDEVVADTTVEELIGDIDSIVTEEEGIKTPDDLLTDSRNTEAADD